MDGFCRGCLNKFDDPVELLQYTEEKRRLFVYSTGLQVKRNDAFTFQLCKECYFNMKMSCKFKKMCRTSDKKIKNYLSLKDDDESLDFNTFLKRNEDSLIFRLPMLSGASTPANQKAKDDDNESTCTSIQNFMTDILRADEIPDSEARIIRQVIEEEADVLEDSLDSHWLENDDEIDEFRLDLSLSRFSTPKSTNQERMTSPDHREITSGDITSGEDYDNIPIDASLKKLSDPVDNSYVLEHVLQMAGQNDIKKPRCVIDKNLEKALKDENNQEFSLEELLASPVFPSKSGASTPTIKQIIFGDKVKNNKKPKSPKFESDLDLLMGKLDKGMKAKELQRGKCDMEIRTGKVLDGKHDLGMKNNMKLGKENVHLRKVNEGKKIDLGKYSAGKILQEKLDISKGKLNEEKKLFKGKLGKFYEENMNLENFDIGNIEQVQPEQQNLNIENQHDDKVDINIEMLLDGNHGNQNPGNGDNEEALQIEIFGDGGGEFIEDDSDDDILEEFLNAEKEKLANVEMKKKAVTNLVNAALIDDAELTELLQEAYDHNVEIMKGKKIIHTQSPQRGVKLPKKMISPAESKYCLTNFYCKMCDVKFESLKALKIHFTKGHRYRIKTPKKPWKVKMKMCDLCGRTFTNTKSLVRHLENHDKPKEYSCEKCTLTFKSEHSLKNHKMTHTVRTGVIKAEKKLNDLDMKYVCKICGAISTSSSNHITHERRHTKSYTLHCEDCGMGFYRKNELVTHRRQHTGEKPFSCIYCDQSFSRRDTLNRHLKRHTDEKRYSCQYCNKKFTKSYDVKIHQVNNKNCLQLREH